MEPEIALIARIAARTTRRAGVTVGIGDDAAVLAGDPPLLVAQDMLVEGVHFRRATTGLGDLGHKALAVNLSDIAAMGGQPVAATVALGLPAEGGPDAPGVEALYDGMEALAARTGCTIAGGDVTTAPALVLSVAVVGRATPGVPPLLRGGARPGDLLCVTGVLGAAAAGLLVLEDPLLAVGVAEADALRAAQRRPEPRLAAGRALAAGGATAMLDCSDGLALDALRMALASGLSAIVDLDAVPRAPGVDRVAAAAGRAADVLAATGGEDYELIAAVPPALLARLRTTLDVPLTPVGRIEAGEPGLRAERGGTAVRLPRLGWEHGA